MHVYVDQYTVNSSAGLTYIGIWLSFSYSRPSWCRADGTGTLKQLRTRLLFNLASFIVHNIHKFGEKTFLLFLLRPLSAYPGLPSSPFDTATAHSTWTVGTATAACRHWFLLLTTKQTTKQQRHDVDSWRWFLLLRLTPDEFAQAQSSLLLFAPTHLHVSIVQSLCRERERAMRIG